MSLLPRTETSALVSRGASLAALGTSVVAVGATLLLLRAQGGLSLMIAPEAPQHLPWVLVFGVAGFTLRFVRWHILATALAPGLGTLHSLSMQCVGTALSLTPGRLGELFKVHLLGRHASIPLGRAVPIFFLERAMDGGAFMVLGLLSGSALVSQEGSGLLTKGAIVGVAFVVIALGASILRLRRQARVLSREEGAAPESLPMAAVYKVASFGSEMWRGACLLLSLRRILVAGGISLLARIMDGLLLYFSLQLFGVNMTVAGAMFLLSSAGLAGGMSMLPGGLGVVEASMVGVQLALGVPTGIAVASTLTMRMFTLWLWVLVGLGVLGWQEIDRALGGRHED